MKDVSTERLVRVLDGLTQGAYVREELTVDEFRDIYQRVYDTLDLEDKTLAAIFLGSAVFAWFLSRPNMLFHIARSRPISENDLSFVLNRVFTGAVKGTYSPLTFALDEMRSWKTWVAAALAALAGAYLSVFAVPGAASMLAQALLPAIALFVSVFALFSVGQSFHGGEGRLILTEVYHRYGQTDKYIVLVLALGLVLSTAGLLADATRPTVPFLSSSKFAFAVLSLSFGIFLWALIAVVTYYFERSEGLSQALNLEDARNYLQAAHAQPTTADGDPPTDGGPEAR